MNPKVLVTLEVDGVDTTPYTGEEFIEEHDIVVLEARKEGARMLLQQMEDALYSAAANGDQDPQLLQGAKVQLMAARGALDGGLVDFKQEIRP